MKIKALIYRYNILTVLFAVMTLGSLGALTSGNFSLTLVFVAGFAYMTVDSYKKEEYFRARYKRAKRAKAKKAALSVYSAEKRRDVSVA